MYFFLTGSRDFLMALQKLNQNNIEANQHGNAFKCAIFLFVKFFEHGKFLKGKDSAKSADNSMTREFSIQILKEIFSTNVASLFPDQIIENELLM